MHLFPHDCSVENIYIQGHFPIIHLYMNGHFPIIPFIKFHDKIFWEPHQDRGVSKSVK